LQLSPTATISGGRLIKEPNSTPTFKYQWQSSTTNNDASFVNISGATNASYQPGTLTQTTYFRRLAGAPLSKSNVVTITIDPCLNRPVGANFDKPFEIGILNTCTNYSQTLPGQGVINTKANCFGNEVGEPSDDIFYRFTLNSPANVRIRSCSEWKQNILLYNLNRTQIAASPYNKYCEELPGEVYEINTNLSAGTYFFAIEGTVITQDNFIHIYW
jgi:hypothetical protein